MSKTIVAQTMSLDDYIAAADDDVWPLFGLYTAGDTEFPVAGTPRPFKMSKASKESPFTFITDGVRSAVA